MRTIIIAAAALLASPALGQTNGIALHKVDVTGHGRISVPPDTAMIHYWVRGEGKTSDDATRAMVVAKRRVEGGLRGLLGRDAEITNSNLLVIEVRDPRCSDQGQPRLSGGDCAVIGYLARSEADVTTSALTNAGTAVGLAGRLGASDARLNGFELRDTTAARKAAMMKAIADARDQAATLAAAAGGHVGRVLDIRYGSYIQTVTAQDLPSFASAPPPPPPPPPPVEVNLTPRPQEISADVSVSYELLP